jgi:DNA polymerase-3 subunit gamma/tau
VADSDGAAPQPYQFLYRRFRPQRFDEVLGQDHVSQGLRTAVREHRVGHAYLFSGPRGTGKTSTARILAMALNCEDPRDGEPDGVCASCVEIAQGTSLDVHELDAASNNGVDAMRDLVARAALGTPGRWKVYIVDEVHMLSTAASNALLKTLEEPPGHVVFVLATTDPQKVLPTVRSRTQHYEFRLLDPQTLVDLLGRVAGEAGLELPPGAVDAAVRRGRGSARDALSALDQMAAGGVVDEESPAVAELAEALAERDTRRVLVATAAALGGGLDPLRLAGELVEYLRQGFLAAVAPELVTVTGAERDQVAACAAALGLPALVRAMEALGRVQVDMRDSADTRVDLEVALIRISHPEVDADLGALTERVERLERALTEGTTVPSPAPATPRASTRARASGSGAPGSAASGSAPSGSAPSGSASSASAPSTSAPSAEGSGGAPDATGTDASGAEDAPSDGPGLARQALGAVRNRRSGERGERGEAAGTSATADPGRAPDDGGRIPADSGGERDERGSDQGARERGSVALAVPTRDDLVEAWGDRILQALPDRARARFRAGRWTSLRDGRATFALPNDRHRTHCEVARPDVEAKLNEHFGVPIAVELVVDDDGVPSVTVPSTTVTATDASSLSPSPVDEPTPPVDEPPPPEPDDDTDFLDPAVLAAETDPAGAGLSAAERLKQLFPGAEEV